MPNSNQKKNDSLYKAHNKHLLGDKSSQSRPDSKRGRRDQGNVDGKGAKQGGNGGLSDGEAVGEVDPVVMVYTLFL